MCRLLPYIVQHRYLRPFIWYDFEAYYSQGVRQERHVVETHTDSKRDSLVFSNAGKIHCPCAYWSTNAEGDIDVTSRKVNLRRRPGGEYYYHSYKPDARTHRTRNPANAFAPERACPRQPRAFLDLNAFTHELLNLRMSLDSCQDLARHRSGSPLQVCRI